MTTTTDIAQARRAPKKGSRTRPAQHGWDTSVLLGTVALLAIGMIALFSASYSTGLYRFQNPLYFISRQLVWAAVGAIALLVLALFDYHRYVPLEKLILFGSLAMLVLVLTPLGTASNGARRWLFGFQPSEVAKLAVIICFAIWISRAPESVRSIKGLIMPYGVQLVAIAGLLLLEPHTSATVIMVGIGVLMLFVGGMRLWYFIPVGIGGAALGAVFYLTQEHVRARISVWLNPFLDIQDKGMQGAMSQIAIGSGGLFGLGLGQGRQKHLYLPEPQNDFIFSSWCEEMGLIGAIIVMILFAFLIYRGLSIARNAPDRLGCLLAVGITGKLAIQTIMNLYVVTGIMPVTGASLPFFSYGGTALMLQMAEIGILLNISRQVHLEARQQE